MSNQQFMNAQQALRLLELMKQQARNGLMEIFPATELQFNKALYPAGSDLPRYDEWPKKRNAAPIGLRTV